ncbi:MAG: hypothetical protein WBF45_03840, partial [Acidobacteriaceae bacterium]
GDIDVENLGVELRLADRIGLFVRTFFNEDALRRAFFFADEAGDAAQPLLPVVAVVDEEGKIPIRLNLRQPLFRILNGGQSIFADVAAQKIPGRFRQSLQDAFTKHRVNLDFKIPNNATRQNLMPRLEIQLPEKVSSF